MMAGLGRELAPSELNDVFWLFATAQRIRAHSLDDIERFSEMCGVSLIPKLQGDLLDHVRGIIESEGESGSHFGGKSR